ncbi:MKNK1 isoform 14, partial [Pongo abelii]
TVSSQNLEKPIVSETTLQVPFPRKVLTISPFWRTLFH